MSHYPSLTNYPLISIPRHLPWPLMTVPGGRGQTASPGLDRLATVEPVLIHSLHSLNGDLGIGECHSLQTLGPSVRHSEHHARVGPKDWVQGPEVSPEATFTHEQHHLVELPAMTEMLALRTPSIMVATCPLWLWPVVSSARNHICFNCGKTHRV